MSVAAAERKVAQCKEALRRAYEDLYAERDKAAMEARAEKVGHLTAANERLQRFCDNPENVMLIPFPTRQAIDKLPLRLRFVACAMALDLPRKKIAPVLPKLDGHGGFVKMGITLGGLHKLIVDARSEIDRYKDLHG